MRTFSIMLILALSACETKEHAEAELGALSKAKTAAAKASAHANMSQTEAIGVPDCDDYIRKYETCLAEKVPQEKRAELRRTLDQQRNKWRDAVTGGESQDAVAQQCRSANNTAQSEMGDYGCSW